ncbi:hypothetical protein BDZ91DRAFT_91338 [Kalaharituber pfeilii]|nr:hypothetical protein BDZ91DRAFT_91338 [Kalaharituber pfeilii]
MPGGRVASSPISRSRQHISMPICRASRQRAQAAAPFEIALSRRSPLASRLLPYLLPLASCLLPLAFLSFLFRACTLVFPLFSFRSSAFLFYFYFYFFSFFFIFLISLSCWSCLALWCCCLTSLSDKPNPAYSWCRLAGTSSTSTPLTSPTLSAPFPNPLNDSTPLFPPSSDHHHSSSKIPSSWHFVAVAFLAITTPILPKPASVWSTGNSCTVPTSSKQAAPKKKKSHIQEALSF